MKDRIYEIALNPKYDGYHRGLASMVYKIFNKKAGSQATNKATANINESTSPRITQNSKTVIQKFEKRKFVLDFRIIFGQHIFTKYAWLTPPKDKKANCFIQTVNEY